MPRLLTFLLLAGLAAALWFFRTVAVSFDMFGWGASETVLLVLAWIATALLAAFVISQLILHVFIAGFFDVEPSGLHRALVFSLVTFAATAVVLARFGVDVGSLLTTSALLAGFVGLATRATIGSLIAGSTLDMDRTVRVGDAIVQGGESIEILSLDWRSVTGRKPDGSLVVLPNSSIADNTLEVVRGDAPVRSEIVISVPAGVPPGRVSEVVGAVVGDFAQIDFSRPIAIGPANFDAGGTIKYVLRYWVAHYADRAYVETEVLRRVWYAFQRERIPGLSANLDEELRRVNAASLRAASEALLRQTGSAPLRSALADFFARAGEEGELLLYAPGEKIAVPERLDGCKFLLIDGELRESDHGFSQTPTDGSLRAGDGLPFNLTRRIALNKIAEKLSQHIGPYARVAIEREAARNADLAAVCTALANEIADPQAREAFLRQTREERAPTLRPGVAFGTQRDLSQGLVSKPLMRALGSAILLAIPADVSARDTATAGTGGGVAA
ncbi:MAG TPA: mechanosensitive ion channel domain-containing protein [Xanthobacteraceae bacterium]|nr:mechanosensitive ion channel domain-containing protein [Xanthobacteraceae bacterium]